MPTEASLIFAVASNMTMNSYRYKTEQHQFNSVYALWSEKAACMYYTSSFNCLGLKLITWMGACLNSFGSNKMENLWYEIFF